MIERPPDRRQRIDLKRPARSSPHPSAVAAIEPGSMEPPGVTRSRRFSPSSERNDRPTVVWTMLLTLCAAGCSTAPPGFAEWTVPVPEGTRTIELTAGEMPAPGGSIDLVEEVTLDPTPDDRPGTIVSPAAVAAGDDGRIYVLDAHDARVWVHDADGRLLFDFGRRGEGPGEWDRAVSLAIAGDRIVVFEPMRARLIDWSLDGDFLGERRLSGPVTTSTLVGREDGSLVGFSARATPDGRLEHRLVSVPPGSEEVRTLLDWPAPASGPLPGNDILADILGFGREAALAPRGPLFVTPAKDYQLLAVTGAGEIEWALRVARARQELTPQRRRQVEEFLGAEAPELIPGASPWPERLPSIADLRVDGHGHLYVFPYVWTPPDEKTPTVRPVEVFDAGGRPLFTGRMPRVSWNAVAADLVYAIVQGGDGERTVRRYRLVEPF